MENFKVWGANPNGRRSLGKWVENLDTRVEKSRVPEGGKARNWEV